MESKVRGIKVGKIWIKVHKIGIFKWASNKMATHLVKLYCEMDKVCRLPTGEGNGKPFP